MNNTLYNLSDAPCPKKADYKEYAREDFQVKLCLSKLFFSLSLNKNRYTLFIKNACLSGCCLVQISKIHKQICRKLIPCIDILIP